MVRDGHLRNTAIQELFRINSKGIGELFSKYKDRMVNSVELIA